MMVNRELLLQELESVQPGLARKEIVQQTASFVFKDGMVMTWNDEISCKTKSLLDFTGAVYAEKLLQFLKKSKVEEVEVIPKDGELMIKGKKERAYARMESEILLPIEMVDPPKKWHRLNEEFLDAVAMVQECASDDQSAILLTYLHITDKKIEAADNHQGIKYSIKTKFEKDTLIKKSSIKHITSMGMTHFSEAEGWVHFKNSNGLVFSCRRWEDTYPSLRNFFKTEKKGKTAVLPQSLIQPLETGNLWSSEIKDKDGNEVTITMGANEIRIKAPGVTGRYIAERKIRYSGKPIKFLISPKLLVELLKRHSEIEITKEALKVNGSKFLYIAVIGEPSDKEKK